MPLTIYTHHRRRYTHYFYNVLGAMYTMPAWRLNDVPLQLYFATFFYFCFYHTLSNRVLRKVVALYRANASRTLFLIAAVLAMSYFTGNSLAHICTHPML